MYSQRLFHLLLTFCLIALALCTKRTAHVMVRNDTPDTISAVSISHKYSDDYKNQLDYPSAIAPGRTTPEALPVEYKTGDLELGRDWWIVTYHRSRPDAEREGELKMWYTDPANFRSVIDALEKAAPTLIKAAINAAKGSNPALLPAAKAAQVAAKVMNKFFFNRESTTGYKQHILRKEDAERITLVVIHEDNTVTFQSKSGKSKTKTSTKWVPVEHA